MLITTSKLSNYSYFSTKSSISVPPCKPVVIPKWGEYCIKAEADIFNEKREKIGCVIGYDNVYEIVKTVTDACEFNTRRRKMTCGETNVTILPHNSKFVCSGIFFKYFNKTNKF